MSNKKSFFEKLTTGIKFNNNDEDYDMYEDEFLEHEDDDRARKLSIEEDEDLYEDEAEVEEVGELSVDMYQVDKAIIIKTMVAGIQKSDIDITLTRDMVVIEGTRARDNHGKVHETYFEELYWGAFERTIELPEEIDIELAEAHENHGLLTLVLPLVDKHKQARIKIQ